MDCKEFVNMDWFVIRFSFFVWFFFDYICFKNFFCMYLYFCENDSDEVCFLIL